MLKPLRVAIVGNGVAGKAAALQLSKLSSDVLQFPLHIFDSNSTASEGREIGIGLWSTALEPFRLKFPSLVSKLECIGLYCSNVGYREPSGEWLLRYKMGNNNRGRDEEDNDDPRLLFVNENELYAALHSEISNINAATNVADHHVAGGGGNRIEIQYGKAVNDLVLSSDYSITTNNNYHHDHNANRSKLLLSDGSITDEQYDMIIVADGMNSSLRTKLGGPGDNEQLFALQDRGYNVFRGNAPLRIDGDQATSWQTWGIGSSMRFATVPLKKGQVWFATSIYPLDMTMNNNIEENINKELTKSRLLESFGKHWHEPICELIQMTEAENIIAERAYSHTHRLNPQSYQYYKDFSSKLPFIHFIGDADYCIDPVLAQGFTIALEDSVALANTLTSISRKNDVDNENIVSLLKQLHAKKTERLRATLKTTNLVQHLAQPRDSSSIAVAVSLRRLMKLTPDPIMGYVFNQTMKYSVGMLSSKPYIE